MALDKNRKRARTEAQKEDRRAALEAAARAYLAESGFDGMTMNGLAKRAGVAKGTLYLYFRTKEEVLLSLFVAALSDWVAQLQRVWAPGMDDATLAQEMAQVSQQVPLFLPLYARLAAAIENNVDDAPLVDAKRAIYELLSGFAEDLARIKDLAPDRAVEVGASLMVALQGAAQLDISAQQDVAHLPEDVQALMAMSAFDQRFPTVAEMILTAA